MASITVGHPESTEFAAFYAGYVQLVTEEPLVALESQGRKTQVLLAGLTDAQAGHRYAEGKWTVRDVAGHMGDVERVLSYRALRIARGDATALHGFDENAYADVAGADRRPIGELAAELAAVRSATLALFRGFDAAAWRRRGVANGNPVSVRALAHIIAGHERHHSEILRTRYGIAGA
jgi:DinB superfamily